ncbi:endonuclease/exonuclease/phosphatase family protein [Nonlabens ponticola]|uniref:Endonuclease/exonuclease/phosphatase family protein n=2 Tax=Nonlabens ponticola TaxID=2496866 RepID=A0A3S9N124_9FLAO|nr:endonuclease/exonuclease/phosphatase family protein [Nonlabens ponticola]
MKLRIVFQVVGLIAALLSLMPLIAADFWWVRIFDFPHLQLTGFTLLAIILYFVTFNPKWINDYLYITVLLGCFVFQCSKILDYTPIVGLEVLESSSQVNDEDRLKIYTANVLQSNKKNEKLFDEISERQPDLIVFTETNDRWMNEIRIAIGDDYPYKVEQPQDNTYGMLVYSKLPLSNTSVQFMVDPKIPSIHAQVEMRNGNLFQLYAIHPTPPMPQHNDMSTDRDTELMKTALMSNKSELPVIVLGDFNDVAWSDSTELTKTVAKLLDLRIGRGFYNTFHAQYFFFRWPLDHILIAPQFFHEESGTGVNFGSDHFPSYAYLTYEPARAKEQKAVQPTAEDWRQVKDQMSEQGMEEFGEMPDSYRKAVESLNK